MAIKAVILNGSNAMHDGCDALTSRVGELLSARGVDSRVFDLRDHRLAHCVGCFECWVKTPGSCRAKDAGGDIVRDVIQSDLSVWVTPVTFGGFSAQLKKIIDRHICLISPFFQRIDGEVHHRKRYRVYPGVLAIGTLAKPDPEAAELFERLVGRVAINFHAPAAPTVVVERGQPAAEVDDALSAALTQLERVLAERAA